MELTRAFAVIWNKLLDWATDLITMLPNLAAAIVVVVLFTLVSRWVAALVSRLLTHMRMAPAAVQIVARITQLGLWVSGVLVALSILQLDKAVTSLLAGVGIVGLALGFAFQDLASNFVAGIALSFGARFPFQIGDLIETNGVLGVAEHTFLRNSVIRTLDGNAVVLPNRKIFEDKLVNYSGDPYRRVQLVCGISYGEDLRKVKALVLEVIAGMTEHRMIDRPVDFFWTGYNESSIDFEVRFWIPFKRQTDYLEAHSEAVMRVKEAFDRDGITIPFPIRTLDFGIKGGARLDALNPVRVISEVKSLQGTSGR